MESEEINEAVKHPGGRPTKYKISFNKQVYKLCLLGSTDVQIADFFEVHVDSIYEWKIKHPKFSEAIKKGKIVADANIADGLYNRANGMVITTQQAIKLTSKEPVLNGDGEPTRQMIQTEKVVIVDLKSQIPPDTTAAIIWLKNRNPQNWKDKQVVEQTGANGGAIQHDHMLKVEVITSGAPLAGSEKEVIEALGLTPDEMADDEPEGE